MSPNTEQIKKLCDWLEKAGLRENYNGIIQSLSQLGLFRSVWANVAEGKELYRCRKHEPAYADKFFYKVSDLGYIRNEDVTS